MTDFSRRRLLSVPLLLAGASVLPLSACQTQAGRPAKTPRRWGRGFEGQRIGDRGDGTFLNPIFAGDHPDPALIRDGDTYYVTFSSFEAYPGLLIYRSHDLVNWEPLAPALHTYIGSVWAPDLVKHDGRYFLYIPARTDSYKSIYVIHAENIEGPWSEPVDLNLPDHIDPGHIVGEDGKRYLFLSSGDMVQVDGLTPWAFDILGVDHID
ncbi:MAG: family 43 glycosylhydrolase [Henriciella sp.]